MRGAWSDRERGGMDGCMDGEGNMESRMNAEKIGNENKENQNEICSTMSTISLTFCSPY